MRTMTRAFVIGCLATSMLTACNGGLKTQDSASAGSGNNGQSTPGGGGSTPRPIDSVDMKSYIEGSEYDKTKTFDLDKTTGDLLVNLPLGLDSSILIGNASVQQLPGVTFSTIIGTDGRTYLQLRVPIKYVLRGVSTLPAGKLPNGDALPLMPAGEYPSLAFQINTNNAQVRNIYLYVGVDAIGVYAESPWVSCYGLPVCLDRLSFPVKNSTGTKISGYFSLIMPKGQSLGGFFVSTVVPPSIAAILDEYFIH